MQTLWEDLCPTEHLENTSSHSFRRTAISVCIYSCNSSRFFPHSIHLIGIFFWHFDFQLSWLQQKLLTSSQFNSTRAHTCKLKWILYEQKRSVLDWVDDQSHDSHVFSLRFLFSDDCFDCVWIVDGPEAISVSYLWSQIFTKFKCNNAHAHSFGRKTLSVSEYASLSELCVASFYCTKLVNASSLSLTLPIHFVFIFLEIGSVSVRSAFIVSLFAVK